MQTIRRPHLQVSNKSRASALIGALVMVAIIGFAVGVMLLTANHSIRVSREKIMYEEAYQAAISGTHIVRAWLIDPALMQAQTGGGAAAAGAPAPSSDDALPVMVASASPRGFGPQALTEFGMDIRGGAAPGPIGGGFSPFHEAQLAQASPFQPLQIAAVGGGVDDETEQLSGTAGHIQDLMENANIMGQEILEDYSLADLSPAAMVDKWFPDAEGTVLPDGRIVLFSQFPKNASGSIAALDRTKDGPNKNKSIFASAGESDMPNYVADLRITTISPKESGNGALRRSSFVIESKGVAVYAGLEKTRVVQQRVLVYPQKTVDPLLGANEALIVSGSYVFGGNSHGIVRWAPALASGDIKLLDLTLTKNEETGEITLDSFNKSIVGRGIAKDGQSGTTGVPDYWVKWKTGVDGELLSNGQSLFKDLPAGVVDFFTELYNGQIPGLTPDMVNLTGNYVPPESTTPPDPNNPPLPADNPMRGLVDLDEDGVQHGSLVEGSAAVDNRIDSFFTRDADMEFIKQMAIESGTYIQWSNKDGCFVNSDGQVLYADGTGGISPYGGKKSDKLTNISQISMTKMLDNKNETISVHSKDTIPDRLLFVDAPGKTIDPSGFFWKGIMYANCNVAGNGKGGASVWAKNPDQYANEPFDDGINDKHIKLDNVFMDGIFIANGSIDVGGNITIYGTMATTEDVILNGTPTVYYNSANAAGRMQKPSDEPQDQRVIAGRISEPDNYKLVWGGISEE